MGLGPGPQCAWKTNSPATESFSEEFYWGACVSPSLSGTRPPLEKGLLIPHVSHKSLCKPRGLSTAFPPTLGQSLAQSLGQKDAL